MPLDIPAPVLEADRIRHNILRRVAFSRHLNPCNADAARRSFVRGAEAPPFEYIPLVEADDVLRELDACEPPRDHPAGALVGRCFDDTRRLVVALRDRTAASFDAMARAADWYPDAALLGLRFDEGEPDRQRLDLGAGPVIARLRGALVERGLADWRVEEDTVMAARVLVDGAKQLLRVNPDARFRTRDVERLVVHEIDVHAMRAANGAAQPLCCFQTGLPGSLATEEGLAMVSEEAAGFCSPGMLARQVEVVTAIHNARTMTFRELYGDIAERSGPGLAWGICLRIKRGLARPAEPGVYAKDSVYLRGRMAVAEWLDAGGDVRHLYVGKVGIDDPVRAWLDQGWIRPGAVPPTWAARA
jgi:hypothetical protein